MSLRFRPALWPTVITLTGLVVLAGLGSWQLVRLDWKQDLITKIESQLDAPVLDLPVTDFDPDTINYRPVRIRGVFHHDKEIYLIAHTKHGGLGYHVITPMERAEGGFVLVNRGWVPMDGKDPATRAGGQLTGVVDVVGVARSPWDQRAFVPDNDLEKNVWFYGDLAGMAAHLGLSVAPVFVEADGTKNPGGWPQGGQTKVRFTNNHLQYALVWYGLAIALLVIYLLYHLKERRI